MTTQVIVPSIGRVLWLHLSFMTEDEQPLSASVAYVHEDRDENDDYLVNLGYLDKFGNGASVQRVRLWQGEEQDRPIGELYAEWMPYQKTQAAKTDVVAPGGEAPQAAQDKVAALLKT